MRPSEIALQQLEVELKFPIAEPDRLIGQLKAAGCEFDDIVEQADLYFAHPCRDFVSTDEALRLRRTGNDAVITYKGPKLDLQTKTRREIELPIQNGEKGYQQYRELLEVLGFRPIGEVRKQRQNGHVVVEGKRIEIAIDRVEGLGDFLEVEIVSPVTEFDSARARILSFAASLGLVGSERRGYLAMLMQKGNIGPTE